jgi:kinesin family member 5
MAGDIDSEEHKGIIPRIVGAIFDRIEEMSGNIEFTVKVSMVEIYMERIKVISQFFNI